MSNVTNRAMLRTGAAASYIGLSSSTLEKLRLRGGGPIYCQPTRAVLYDPDDLDRWLALHRRSSTSTKITKDETKRNFDSKTEEETNG